MKSLTRFCVIAALAATLAGCAGAGVSVFQGGTSITAPIQNPVGRDELATIWSAYGAAAAVAVNYRRLGICASGTVETLSRPCARRNVVAALREHSINARRALNIATRFVRDNPNVSALIVLAEARRAVAEFQAVANSTGAR
jgi:hypothetical protein